LDAIDAESVLTDVVVDLSREMEKGRREVSKLNPKSKRIETV
jgi:hypothetical protein